MPDEILCPECAALVARIAYLDDYDWWQANDARDALEAHRREAHPETVTVEAATESEERK